MIISGANEYEFFCSLYKLEQINTRLDTLTQIFLPKYCNGVTAYKKSFLTCLIKETGFYRKI